MSRLANVLRWAALLIGAAIAAIIGALLLGAYLPSIPTLSPIGSQLLGWLAPWFVVLPLLAALLVWAGPRRRPRLRRGLSVFAFGVALAALVAAGRMGAAARDAGVPIQIGRTFATHKPITVTPDHEAVYATFEGAPLRVALYRPEARSPAPVVVYIHGGGWMEGDRHSGGENMRWFARQGMLAISLDYSLSSKGRHLWNVAPAQIGCALAWVKANAARYGGDPSRISLLGDSAGGNLALIAGYRANTGTMPSACGGTVPRISAVSAIYPAVRLAEAYRNDFPAYGDMAREALDAYAGGPPEKYPARYAEIDPASYLGPKAPPTLIIVGENDHLLPPRLAYRFAEDAARSGVKLRLVRFPFGQHAFDQSTNSIGNQLVLGASERHFAAHPRLH